MKLMKTVKNVYDSDPWGLSYKTSIDRFRSKLVPFLLSVTNALA
jgi:hypothetical protein